MVLVLGAGAEELLPKLLGVGFPILLTAAQVAAAGRGSLPARMAFVAAAGAMEDAICSLPPMTSISYFLIVGAFVRWTGLTRGSTLLTYPCYQVWLWVWASGLGGEVCARLLVALPIGLFTAYAVNMLIVRIKGKAAADEEG